MFCSNCGKEIAAGAKFCANCGAAVNSQPTSAAEPPKAPAPTAQREVPTVERVENPIGNMTGSGGQPEKKKKRVPKPLIIVVAVLVLFVGFGAVLSLFGDGSEPDFNSGKEPDTMNSELLDTDSKPQPAEISWIENIPYVPGYADLFYFEDSGVRSHERSHAFEAGGIEDFMGLSPSEQVSYSTTNIDGGTICFGQVPERTVSYAEIWDGTLEAVSNYYPIVVESEPVVGKRDDGYCFLFYKRDYDDGGIESYCYEIYMVQQTDSPNYEDWLFRAYIYVNAPEFYDYLNGVKELEIVSIPAGNAQHEMLPENGDTPSTSDAIVPDWVDKIPEVPGTPSENTTGLR